MAAAKEMERRNGIALWRQIADSIRTDIGSGAVRRRTQADARTRAVAQRFGVNRHTVREAIASLVHEGVLRSEQGRGTFVAAAPAASPTRSARARASRPASTARRKQCAEC